MRTRIIVGTILTLLAVGVLYGDHMIGSPYPFLLLLSLLLAGLGSFEFVRLLPVQRRPCAPLVIGGSVVLLLRHWYAAHHEMSQSAALASTLQVLTALVLLAFLVEMYRYREPGESTNRVALTVFGVAYIGMLAGFFIDLRLFQADPWTGSLGLFLAIFVPKGCDIGAYFSGSFFGKHKMTPVLSPKKTWEGAAGGLLLATGVALAVQAYHPVIPGGGFSAAAFGFCVGLAGMLGDLAESLIKRDCGSKDSARLIPGFGGILDVVDAILFAAPVVYLWLGRS